VTVFDASNRREAPTHQGLIFWLSAWLPVAIGMGVIMLESTEMLAPTKPAIPCAGFGRPYSALSQAPAGK